MKHSILMKIKIIYLRLYDFLDFIKLNSTVINIWFFSPQLILKIFILIS